VHRKPEFKIQEYGTPKIGQHALSFGYAD